MIPSKLDLYLASYFAQRDWLALVPRAASLDRAMADQTRRDANAKVFHSIPAHTDAVLGFFGAPVEQDYTQLLYHLDLWPEHRFAFSLQDREIIFGEQFERVSRQQRLAPASRAQMRETLIFGYHTWDDLEGSFGRPDSDESWYPDQTLYYTANEGQRITVDMLFGLVCAVRLEAHRGV